MLTLEPRWRQTLYGNLALDFTNTLDWRTRRDPVEMLREYRDLLRFALAAKALGPRPAARLLAWSARHPARARRALVRAIRVREAVAAVFQAVARGRPVPARALAALERACRDAFAARALRADRGHARWTWRDADPDPDRLTREVALTAERLLLGARPPVRECAGAGCGWLFLDTSRNHTRRWCSMRSCGNREKARRFYRRRRARPRGPSRRRSGGA